MNNGLSARMLRAWRETDYGAGDAIARIGCRSPEIDALLRQHGARQGGFITAWNPLGRRMPERWNRHMAARLQERLRGLASISGQGRGRDWAEEHMLVAADPRRLIVLARLFRQLGIVVVRVGQPARAMMGKCLPDACNRIGQSGS